MSVGMGRVDAGFERGYINYHSRVSTTCAYSGKLSMVLTFLVVGVSGGVPGVAQRLGCVA